MSAALRALASPIEENNGNPTKTYNRFPDPGDASAEIAGLRELHAAMDRTVLDAYGWQDVQPACGFALDWLDLDDDELAETLASVPDDIRQRIESADYFFSGAQSPCRFQSHIKKDGKGKLPWRYRWPDHVRDDILARLLALYAQRAELEQLTGLRAASPKRDPDSAAHGTRVACFPAFSTEGMTLVSPRIMLRRTHPQGDTMKANADPDALDGFSNQLVNFIDTLGDAQAALDNQFSSLRDSWDDPQSQQFEQELAELRTVLQRFQASASDHVPYLRALAARLRDYLQT